MKMPSSLRRLRGPFSHLRLVDMIVVPCVAVLFGLCAMLTPVYRRNSTSSCNILLFVVGVLGFLAVWLGLEILIDHACRRRPRFKIPLSGRKLGLCLFALFTAVGVWNLLVYYPGTGMYDTLAIVSRPITQMSNQHPWFYCSGVRLLVKVVLALGGGYELALVLCSVIQILLTSGVYTYLLLWLKDKGTHPVVWLLAVAFYAFYPILGLYMVTLFKDIPFSLLLTVWVPVLYEYWQTKGECLQTKRYQNTCIVLIIYALLRNNGIYVTAFILAVMLITALRQWKQIAMLAAALALVMVGSSAFETYLDVTHLFKETVGIPLQQVAAVVTYGDQIEPEDLEFIDQVLSVDFIREKYDPYTADRLKWNGAPINNDFLNENKVEFLKVWLRLGLKNPGLYWEAYLKNTYGFWSLDGSDINVKYTTLYVQAFDDWIRENEVGIKDVLPPGLQSFCETVGQMTLTPLGAGAFFWIYLLLVTQLLRRYDWRMILLAAPSLGCWLTLMISTPVAYQWRYLFSVPITIPVFLGLLFVWKKKKA